MLITQSYDPNASESQAFIPRNVGWYRKHFKLPLGWNGSAVWIYFEGVFHETTSWLNGRQIGYHRQGYTSFSLRLDNVPDVKFGDEENVLSLYVDASSGTGWWYEGGGLCRHQYLVQAYPLHVEQDGAWVFTSSNSSAAIASPVLSPSETHTSTGAASFHTSVQLAADFHTAGASPPLSAVVNVTVRDTSGAVAASGSSANVTNFSSPVLVVNNVLLCCFPTL
jgi:hypothetical protein